MRSGGIASELYNVTRFYSPESTDQINASLQRMLYEASGDTDLLRQFAFRLRYHGARRKTFKFDLHEGRGIGGHSVVEVPPARSLAAARAILSFLKKVDEPAPEPKARRNPPRPDLDGWKARN